MRLRDMLRLFGLVVDVHVVVELPTLVGVKVVDGHPVPGLTALLVLVVQLLDDQHVAHLDNKFYNSFSIFISLGLFRRLIVEKGYVMDLVK